MWVLFNVGLTLPPSVVWTNQSSISTVVRSAGQLVTWTGGDPNGYISIDGSSENFTSTSTLVGASFHCMAKTSDGSFTIPSVVLLSLPAGSSSIGGFSVPTGSLSVNADTTYVTFTAPGLDLGVVTSSSGSSESVTYQ